MKSIRGGSGIGDALYVRVVAEHFVRAGEKVVACSDHPDVFNGSGAAVEPFRRDRIDSLAHYAQGKGSSLTQWQDVCRSAGIPDIPLQFTWVVRNQKLIDDLRAKAAGRRIIIVHGGRAPMGRTDGFGSELLPRQPEFDAALAALDGCFLVRIGKGTQIYSLRADVDLTGTTSISDLMDLVWNCDGVVGQCSFVVPLAECFNKPLLAVWAAHGMEATRHQYVRTITPKKILSKQSSRFIVDDWPTYKIQQEAYAFRDSL